MALSALVSLTSTVAVSAQANPVPTKQVDYSVVEGDYLDKIATQYGTTWQRLFNKNTNIENPDLIYVGEKLVIPSSTENVAERPQEAPVAPVVTAPVSEPTPAPVAVVEAPVAAPEPAPVVQAPSVSGCGDNFYANYIYTRESTCNTNATNSGGCYGIGQDCNGIVRATCGADYTCQNEYFTNYVNNRYGGWQGAYNFWIGNGWY